MQVLNCQYLQKENTETDKHPITQSSIAQILSYSFELPIIDYAFLEYHIVGII